MSAEVEKSLPKPAWSADGRTDADEAVVTASVAAAAGAAAAVAGRERASEEERDTPFIFDDVSPNLEGRERE